MYDLEKEEDRASLRNHGVELRRHSDKLVVIDEVQHKPELFAEIRTIIDELAAEGRATGKFLLLGSVSRDLQNQSESLAGRVYGNAAASGRLAGNCSHLLVRSCGRAAPPPAAPTRTLQLCTCCGDAAAFRKVCWRESDEDGEKLAEALP